MSDLFERLADRGLPNSGPTIVPTQLVWAGKPLEDPSMTPFPDLTESVSEAHPRKPLTAPSAPLNIVETHHYSQQTIVHEKSPAARTEAIESPQIARAEKAMPQATELHRPIKQVAQKEVSPDQKSNVQRRESDDTKQTFHTTERIVEKAINSPDTLKQFAPNVVDNPVAKPVITQNNPEPGALPPPVAPLTKIQPVSHQTALPRVQRHEMWSEPVTNSPVTITIGPIRVTAPNSVTPVATPVPIQSRAPAGAELKSWLGWNVG